MPTRLVSFQKCPKLDLIFFCNQLARLLSAGYTLPEALTSLESIVNPVILRPLCNSVNKGKGLSKGMSFLPKTFSIDLIKLIAIGEETGFLPQVLEAIAFQEQKRKELSGKIQKVIVYPALILGLSLILVTYMIFFVLPSFQSIFTDLHAPLPLVTKGLLALPRAAQKYGVLLIGGGLLLIGGVSYLLKMDFAQAALSSFLWNQRSSKLYWLAKCFWLVSLFSSVGIPLTTALKQVRSIITNNPLRTQWTSLIISCQHGKTFHLAASEAGFPADACALLAVMEKHGELTEGLQKVSEQYQAELEHFLDKAAALIEPATIIFAGGLVGLIIVNLISPMMQLTQQLL